MDEQVAILARQFAPFILPLLVILPEAALAAILAILTVFATASLLERVRGLWSVSEIARSALADPDVQKANNLTGESAFIQYQGVDLAYKVALNQQVQEYLSTTFASVEELTAARDAFLTADVQPSLTVSLVEQIKAHYQYEYNRLTGVPGVVTAPAETTASVIDRLSQSLTGVLGGIGPALALALPAVGTALAAGMLSIASEASCQGQVGRAICGSTTGPLLLGKIAGAVLPLGIMAYLETPVVRKAITEPITNATFEWLFGLPELGKPITPADGPTVSRLLLERAVGLGIGAHVAAITAEAYTPLKNMGLGYIAAFMADLAGFGRIAAATMGVIETQALRVPMTYHINEKLRSILPGPRELGDMAAERVIDRQKFGETLAFHGYSELWIDKFYDIATTPAKYFVLRAMADAGMYDEAYFRGELQHSGYNDATIEQCLHMLYTHAHGEVKTLFASSALTRFKEGMSDETGLTNDLTTLGVAPALIPKYIYAAKLQADLDDLADYIAALKTAVSKEAITPPDMTELLVKRGMQRPKAELLSQKEAIKLLAKPK